MATQSDPNVQSIYCIIFGQKLNEQLAYASKIDWFIAFVSFCIRKVYSMFWISSKDFDIVITINYYQFFVKTFRCRCSLVYRAQTSHKYHSIVWELVVSSSRRASNGSSNPQLLSPNIQYTIREAAKKVLLYGSANKAPLELNGSRNFAVRKNLTAFFGGFP